MPNQVMQKYRAFAVDYNGGMDKGALCAKYRLKEGDFDAFLTFLKRKGITLKRPLPKEFEGAHEIEFEIYGDDLQFVEVELDPSETAIAEAGAMMYMEQGIGMETIFGDGTEEHDGMMSKIFGAGKRILTGESLFMTAFTNNGPGKRHVAFGAPYPGKIIPLDLKEEGGEMICQKDAFLAAAKGVSVDIAFQRKLGAGFFGGEGFILQRLRGTGYAFIHAGGSIIEKSLAPGETLKLDTGCLVAMDPGVNYDIEFVGGLKSAFFGGEGLFFATVSGPGKVWLQSLPFSRLANRMASAAMGGGQSKGEGSVLGVLGNFMDGS